jgi:hypothetical protein
VRVNAQGESHQIEVWGRSHSFSGPMPSSIRTAGVDIMAGPVRLVGVADGAPIEWRTSGMFVTEQTDTEVVLSAWQASPAMLANATVRVEFDGLIRIALVLVPPARVSPRLDRLWLEVPLRRECATLFHCFPGTWGGANNSGELTDVGLALPFKPFVWIGWEDGGLGWFAESDRHWQPADPQRAIEIVPDSAGMILRIHLLDSPPPRLPATFAFGFQASPVKPWAAEFHEWRVWHAPQLGVSLTLPVPEEWHLCHRAFPDGNPLATLDRAAQAGVKTVVFHEDWAPIQNYPFTTPEAEFKAIVAACHQRGMKVLVYFGYEISSLAPEWEECAEDVLVKRSDGAPTGGWFRPPKQRDFVVCYNSYWADRLAEGIAAGMDRYGYDGIYIDGMIEPWACCNERHGCGYRAADGTLKPTYPVLAVRRFLRRLYEHIHPRGGLISAHQSTCCVTPILGFTHCYWDGEQLTSGDHAADPLKTLSLATFRAEFMGRNFGVPCEFLAYERPPQWTFDHALTVSMLHDVRVRPHGVNHRLDTMSRIWDVMTRFGVTTAEWLPYWKNRFTATPASVKVSAYVHAQQRTLLVVSNLSPSEAVNAVVTLDPAVDACAQARDAITGEALTCGQGTVTVPLDASRMRLVWLDSR